MTGGPGAKDAPHTLSDEDRAREQALFGLGEEERRASIGVGGREPAIGATDRGRAATRLLDPRDRFGGRLGGVRRWIPAQVVGDDGATRTGWRSALYLRLGTVDRRRRGRVPPGHPRGQAPSIQAGARRL